jgi:dihydrofolate reductase
LPVSRRPTAGILSFLCLTVTRDQAEFVDKNPMLDATPVGGNVSKLRFRISMSLDGFVAGPSQSVENPLGVGGMRLHEWVFPLAVWRAMQGLEGGEVNESTQVVEESLANVGATVMGRNMFGGHPGPWDSKKPWNGWWGANPPYHHPVFVLTHHAREPLALEGGTTFTFVTGGAKAALEQARRAAGGKDVSLAGGAKAAQQYLAAGLVDEMEISLAPTLLGSGERLFEGIGADLHALTLVRTIAAPSVTHLKFVRR